MDEQAAATPATGSLRLALQGANADERAVLVAILQVLVGRTAKHWILCEDTAAADLLLATRAARPAGDTLTAVFLREDERAAEPDELVLQAPLRVMAVLDLLNAADDRLRQTILARTAAHETAPVHADDDRSLAAALARLIERRSDATLRVRIVGHGTLYLCLKARIHHCDFPHERLVDALNEHRFVMTMLPSAAAELVLLRDSARPVDEILWQIGLVTPAGQGFSDARAYRLTRWPDFARLAHRPEFIRLCALLSRTHQRIETLVGRSGLRRGEVEHVLHACMLCGWLDIADADVAPAPVPAATVAQTPLAGLFNRLRRRFGL